jgi:hypothetical protein
VRQLLARAEAGDKDAPTRKAGARAHFKVNYTLERCSVRNPG